MAVGYWAVGILLCMYEQNLNTQQKPYDYGIWNYAAFGSVVVAVILVVPAIRLKGIWTRLFFVGCVILALLMAGVARMAYTAQYLQITF